MKQSLLFFKTRKETPTDADSINASYLIRAGFVDKQMAGVYALLPLGFRVYKKIENIIREEMDRLGGQEILMNVLQPKELWDETNRWQEMADIFYQLNNARDKQIGLAPTHEEQVTDIVRKKIHSYKELPFSLYQIQTKFRNEARAKSGLLRTREFIMKDMYSFHTNKEDFDKFYESAKQAYLKVFARLGIPVKIVAASGGAFSKYSHEFQAPAPTGEDTIYFCEKCDFAENKEIAEVKAGDKCPDCQGTIKEEKAIEVGNIFPLSNKFSSAMNAKYLDQEGKEHDIIMGCYGIGLTRNLATAVEIHYDAAKNSMLWPEEIAPYRIHLISLNQSEKAEQIYNELQKANLEVLYDDRELSAGEKFAQADLIGCPIRVIISQKTLAQDSAEVTTLSNNKTDLIPLNQLTSTLS